MRRVERLVVRWARQLCHQGAQAFGFPLPLVSAVHDAVDVHNEEFLRAASFAFACAQLFELDAQQRYFPPHGRDRIGGVRRLWRRKYAHEGLNVGGSGPIRHAQSLAKHG